MAKFAVRHDLPVVGVRTCDSFPYFAACDHLTDREQRDEAWFWKQHARPDTFEARMMLVLDVFVHFGCGFVDGTEPMGVSPMFHRPRDLRIRKRRFTDV